MDQKSISNPLIDTIRERTDLLEIASEYLSLKKTGQNYTGLCPFHQEKTASFVINPVKQFFHCFGCGTGGDVFHFVAKIEGISFPETLRYLAEKYGIPIQTVQSPEAVAARSEAEEIYQLNHAAADYFHHNLLTRSEGAPAVAYLKARGVSTQTIEDFSIGYALPNWDHLLKTLGKRFRPALLEKAGLVSRRGNPSDRSKGNGGIFDRFRNRIIFPIYTPQGKVAGFGGRVLDDAMPKYLNTSETTVFTKGKILFGLHKAKGADGHPLVIVEGYLDAITAHQAGILNVVATLGTALTQAHLQLIRRFSEKIILVFDGDDAGIRAALRAAPLLIDQQIKAHIVSLPPGKDPDAFIREMGKSAFLSKIEKGETVINFSISQSIKKSSLKTVEEKMTVINRIFPLIDRLKTSVEKSHYLNTLSDTLRVREMDLRIEYDKWSKKSRSIATHSEPVSGFQKEVRPPEEQEKILTHLIQGCLDPTTLNGKLELRDFTHATVKQVISEYWNPKDEHWTAPNGPIKMEDEACQLLLSRLSVTVVDPEQINREEEDCIRMLRKKRIDIQINALQLKQKEGRWDLEAENLLQKKILDLKKESSDLTLSY